MIERLEIFSVDYPEGKAKVEWNTSTMAFHDNAVIKQVYVIEDFESFNFEWLWQDIGDFEFKILYKPNVYSYKDLIGKIIRYQTEIETTLGVDYTFIGLIESVILSLDNEGEEVLTVHGRDIKCLLEYKLASPSYIRKGWYDLYPSSANYKESWVLNINKNNTTSTSSKLTPTNFLLQYTPVYPYNADNPTGWKVADSFLSVSCDISIESGDTYWDVWQDFFSLKPQYDLIIDMLVINKEANGVADTDIQWKMYIIEKEDYNNIYNRKLDNVNSQEFTISKNDYCNVVFIKNDELTANYYYWVGTEPLGLDRYEKVLDSTLSKTQKRIDGTQYTLSDTEFKALLEAEARRKIDNSYSEVDMDAELQLNDYKLGEVVHLVDVDWDINMDMFASGMQYVIDGNEITKNYTIGIDE